MNELLSLPSGNFDAYMASIKNIPILTSEEERQLFERYHEQDDLNAVKHIIFSHLRYVAFVAKSYAGYGLPLEDLVQEGNIGLMKAVKRFNVSQGVRLISFAVHYIKAEISEFVLKNWKMVKIATTKEQRKLFFNLRKLKRSINSLNDSEINAISQDLGVKVKEVKRMESRMFSSDSVYDESESTDADDSFTVGVALSDDRLNPQFIAEQTELNQLTRRKLNEGLLSLNEREQDIVCGRWFSENKQPFSYFADKYSLSVEGVRKIEKRAFKQMKAHLSHIH